MPDPGFAGDDGSADPGLVAALLSADEVAVALALLNARVLVPLVALLGDSDIGPDGLRREKTSDIAVVTVQRPDGARALPVFSSTATLAVWDPDARPLPVEGPRAAQAAYTEDAIALLVDPGAPASAVISGALLTALAQGRRWVPPEDDLELAATLDRLLPAGVAWTLAQGPEAPILQLVYSESSDLESIQSSPTQLAHRLGQEPLIRDRLGAGFDLVIAIDSA